MLPQICNSHGFRNTWAATDYHHRVFRAIAQQAENQLPGNIIIIDDTWADEIDTYDKFYARYSNVDLANVDLVLFVALVDSDWRNAKARKRILSFINSKHSCVINQQQAFSFWGHFASSEYQLYQGLDLPWTGTDVFLSYNRKPHDHRVELFNEFQQRGLLKHGIFTLGSNNGQACTIDENQGITDNGAGGDVGIPNDVVSLGNHDIWQRAFINIVTETHMEGNFLSEKIWKPIIGKRPFLVMGPPSVLSQLHNWGFKTFGLFWDQSYIMSENPSRQIAQIITRISGMSHNERLAMYKEMQSILTHNYTHFFGEFTKQNNKQIDQILYNEELI